MKIRVSQLFSATGLLLIADRFQIHRERYLIAHIYGIENVAAQFRNIKEF